MVFGTARFFSGEFLFLGIYQRGANKKKTELEGKRMGSLRVSLSKEQLMDY